MPAYQLISNTLCPYTQRVAIQLAEKGLRCERVHIDLAAKPDWFLQASPLGKVPLLRMGDTSLFETQAICEYLEEVKPESPLHPASAVDRARHRGWIEVASALIGDVFAFYSAPDAAAFDRKAGELAARFAQLEQALGAGPFFEGPRFHLVDAAFAPVFRLFDTLDQIAGVDVLEGLPRVAAYRRALAGRDSVRQAVVPDYGAQFRLYLSTRGSHLSRRLQQAS